MDISYLEASVRREPGGVVLDLRGDDFFVSNRYSIADIALYAYTHVADEGGFDLGRFPAIGAWIELVRAQPGHVPITWDRSEEL